MDRLWTILEIRTSRRSTALCRCVCGTEKIVLLDNLKLGKSKSCGCGGRAFYKQYKKERRAWSLMRYRCSKPSSPDYHNYGGRGIKVCERWLESSHNFIVDMGPIPSPKHTVERIDVNGDYCPENCRWATVKEQGQNKRNTRMVEWQGCFVRLQALAEAYGLKNTTVRERLKRGWSVERAIQTPVTLSCLCKKESEPRALL